MFLIFMIAPLLTVVWHAFSYYGAISLHWLNLVFSDPYYFGLKIIGSAKPPYFEIGLYTTGHIFTLVGDTLYIQGLDFGIVLNSIVVALIVTLISTLLGTVLAFIMARYNFFGKPFFRTALLASLISSPFVGAIGIRRMIGENGIINRLLFDVFQILPFKVVLDGFAAMIFIQILNFYPIVYLNAYSAFVNIDPTLEEQAENMGSSSFHLFRTVTFPLALPGIEAGAILTLILSMEDLGTPVVFKASQAAKTLPFEIFKRIFSPTGEIDPIAPTLSVILLAIAIIGFFVIRRYVSLRRYAIISRGGTRKPRLSKVGKKGTSLFYFFLISLLCVSLIPHVGVFLMSITDYWGNTIFPTKMTLNNYSILFTKPAIANSIINSFIYSTVATILIAVLGTSAAYIIDRKHIPGKGILDTVVTLPVAIPGVVMAIGFFTMFLKTPISPIINPIPLLVMSYTIRKFPFTVRGAYAGLQQTPVEFEEASLNVGAKRLSTILKITLPLIAINVLAGSMLSFVYSMSEVSTSLMFGDVNPDYAPMTWKIQDVLVQLGAGPFYAAALGVLLMVVQTVILIISTRLLGQRATALTGL